MYFNVFYVYIQTSAENDKLRERVSDRADIVIRNEKTKYLMFVEICTEEELEKKLLSVLKNYKEFQNSINENISDAVLTICHINAVSQGFVVSDNIVNMVCKSGLPLQYIRNDVKLTDGFSSTW